jgi:hypothetical protein
MTTDLAALLASSLVTCGVLLVALGALMIWGWPVAIMVLGGISVTIGMILAAL